MYGATLGATPEAVTGRAYLKGNSLRFDHPGLNSAPRLDPTQRADLVELIADAGGVVGITFDAVRDEHGYNVNSWEVSPAGTSLTGIPEWTIQHYLARMHKGRGWTEDEWAKFQDDLIAGVLPPEPGDGGGNGNGGGVTPAPGLPSWVVPAGLGLGAVLLLRS